MILIDERSIEAVDVPGRKLRWLIHPDQQLSSNLSLNVVEIHPGETVKPAHIHPNEDEVVYVTRGVGRVYVDGEVRSLQPGCAVLFPAGAVHMVQNQGTEPLKLVCFFAPPVDFNRYEFREELEFPE